MNIRQAAVDDAAAIAHIHIESWRTTYPGMVPQEYLDNLSIARRAAHLIGLLSEEASDTIHLLAETDSGEPVGFSSFGPDRDERAEYSSEIHALYVLKEHHGTGIGKALFLESVRLLIDRGCDSMMLWVLRDNPACGFYEHLGGTLVGEKTITLGGAPVKGVCCGWRDLSRFLKSLF
ncbi:MAG: GNAT family N-acetyltransferase [Candidatus Zixiibacteriota bacterium]